MAEFEPDATQPVATAAIHALTRYCLRPEIRTRCIAVIVAPVL